MTIEELAGCIAVIKNLLALNLIDKTRAMLALWDLSDSICDSAHYVPGTSSVIDQLLTEI
jgi:hypothetical protein